MPYAAKAYSIIVDNNSTFEGTIGSVDKIVFKVNYTFDGKGDTILQTQSLPMKIEGNGTLKNIKLFSTNGFLGNNNTISIAGSAEECVTFIGGGPISGINFNLLDGSSLLFTGVTLSGGTLSITGNAAFLGALENSTIRISGDYIWSKDRMQLNYFFSSGNTLELGSSENSATLTMEDDIVIDTIIQPDKTLKDPQSVTILGNGNTLSVKKLTAAKRQFRFAKASFARNRPDGRGGFRFQVRQKHRYRRNEHACQPLGRLFRSFRTFRAATWLPAKLPSGRKACLTTPK